MHNLPGQPCARAGRGDFKRFAPGCLKIESGMPWREHPIRAPYSLNPSTIAIARAIASCFADWFPGTDCRFWPGSSKS